jgi:hypothetical protein
VDQEGGIVAYPTYQPAAGHQPRPATVTVSSYLLWVTAAIALLDTILTLSVVGRMTEAYRDVYAGTAAEGSEAVIVAVSVVGVVINILFAAGLAILAVFNNRGRQGARVTTWVLGGISLCCGGLGLAGTALTSSMNFDAGSTGGPSASEVERRLSEVLPSWYGPLSTTLAVLSLLAILAAMILLALPASHAYFRRPVAAGWDPSMPYPYPPAGTPGAGQPYPPYPGPGFPPAPPAPVLNDPSVPHPTGPPPGGMPPGATPPGPGTAPPGSTGTQPPGGASGATPPSGPPSDPWGRPARDDDQRPPGGSAT